MKTRPPTNPKLLLSKAEMQRLGYKVVDYLVAHFDQLSAKKPVVHATRAEMDQLLEEKIPEHGSCVDDVLEHVINNVLANSDLLTHPKFFSFVPSPNNFVSAMADSLVSGFNIFCGGWVLSPSASEIEIITINWLLELFNFPLKQGGGFYTSGGSMANLTAIATARKMKIGENDLHAILYWSDEAHSSIHLAAKVLGFRDDQIRLIPTDDQFRMRVNVLRNMIVADKAAGLTPFCVIASSGTTNTGTIDPLMEIADVCLEHKLWFHIDGAFGAAAIITEQGREQLRGIERANSITIDPHKWLFQPYEIGCILVRDHHWLSKTFRQRPEYLRDIEGENSSESGEINFYDQGVQLTRSFRALKLYMSLKTFGLESFRQAIQNAMKMAERTERYLQKQARWQIISPASLAVINFRYRPANRAMSGKALDALNQHISNKLVSSGEAMLATTVLKGRVVLRMCLINPRTVIDDVIQTIKALEQYADNYMSESKKID